MLLMTHSLDCLLAIMAQLRDPEHGCPWDCAQNFATIAPYTIEEAYEVSDAITRDDMMALKDELGDLLFQVVFHSRMAEEAGLFVFADVASAIADKMLRRHPHVFGTAKIASVATAHGWALANLDSALTILVAADSIPPIPNLATPSKLFGSFVSLDGFHPATAGQKLIADLFVVAIDSKYGTTLTPP